MVKIVADVTIKELEAMENKAIAWNLCDKHNKIWDASEEEMFHFTQTCKKCIQINREISSKTLHLWSKLLTAYLKATKKKTREFDKSFSKKETKFVDELIEKSIKEKKLLGEKELLKALK